MRVLHLIQIFALTTLIVAFPTHSGTYTHIHDDFEHSFDCVSRSKGRYDVKSKKSSDDKARFLIIGDWGGLPFYPYTTPSEVAVAIAMGNLGEKLNTSFQLALGDNFYYHGVQSVDDPRFKV